MANPDDDELGDETFIAPAERESVARAIAAEQREARKELLHAFNQRRTTTARPRYGRADVLVVHGGDLQHDVPMPPGDAMMIDKNGDPHWIDYKIAVKDVDFSKIERRVLDHMAVDMAKKIELDIEDTMYGNPKPFRGPRVRDWEQRKKKKRRK